MTHLVPRMHLSPNQQYAHTIESTLGDFGAAIDVLDPQTIDFLLTETEELLVEEIVVPTENVIRVLLTLSCRLPAIFSRAEGNDITRMLQNALHQPRQIISHPVASYNQRAGLILRRLCGIVSSTYTDKPQIYQAVYSTLMNVMADFTSTKRTINQFEFVSDSDEELLLSAVVDEHKKRTIVVSPSKKPRSRNFKKKSYIPADMRIFNEPVITTAVCPSKSSPYNLWSLMEWTFYCCSKSSTVQEKSIELSCFHDLYQGYSRFLLVVWRVVTINFVNVIDLLMNDGRGNHNELVHMFFYSSESKQNEIISALEDPSLFILRALMTQVSGDKEEWYKRITSVVFYGIEEQKIPTSPYASDRHLIRKSNIPCPKQSDRCDSSNDMVESMSLRFEILSLVYYNGLFFDKGDAFLGLSEVDPQDYDLVTRILVQEMAKRLCKFSYRYFKLFFEASLISNEMSIFQVPANHCSRMMMELARELVDTLTGRYGIDLDVRPGASQFPWEVQFAQEMVSIIGQKALYEMIVQESGSNGGLEEAWCKATFLLGWLLDMAFTELQLNSQHGDFLQHLSEGVEQADAVSAKLWRQACQKDELPFVKYGDIFRSRFPI